MLISLNSGLVINRRLNFSTLVPLERLLFKREVLQRHWIQRLIADLLGSLQMLVYFFTLLVPLSGSGLRVEMDKLFLA